VPHLIDEPDSEKLDSLCVEVDKFKLAAHLYWGLWALIQASVSEINFGYMDYAVIML